MNERELPEEAQQIVNSNGELLRDGQFSDENARAGYYDIARGATPELENGLFNCLNQHRPHVAEVIKLELEQV